MKKIGIPACFMHPDVERAVFGHKRLAYIESDMARYLYRKGVIPVLIPDLDDEHLYELCDEMDGFVFQGGSDIAPESYGEAPLHEDKWRGDAYRDAFELKVFDYVMQKGKPILAICRGFQLMNVYFGGTLYQDINTQNENAIVHRDAIVYDRLTHCITFEKGKLLDLVYTNIESPQVNSVHHQGIKTLGRELEVLAQCPDDGMIEAIKWTGQTKERIEREKSIPVGGVFPLVPFVLGVQWHPEFSHTMGEDVIDAELLYDQFLRHI